MNVSDLICKACQAFIEVVPSTKHNEKLPCYAVSIDKLCPKCQQMMLAYLNSMKPKVA